MTGDEFKVAMSRLFGKGWRRRAAEALGVTRQTIYRYSVAAQLSPKITRLIEHVIRATEVHKTMLGWELRAIRTGYTYAQFPSLLVLLRQGQQASLFPTLYASLRQRGYNAGFSSSLLPDLQEGDDIMLILNGGEAPRQ